MAALSRRRRDGISGADDAELHRFIGPAISESMQRNGIPDDKLDEGVRIYRKYYADEAVFDDPNNPGQKVPGRLNNTITKYSGAARQTACRRILSGDCQLQAAIPMHSDLRAFPLGHHGRRIYGASEDNSRLDKDQVIRWAFQHIDFDENAGDKALMVGDRWTDVDGAIACGLDCLGCRWGYAEAGELEEHGAYRIIDTVDELAAAVNDYFAK